MQTGPDFLFAPKANQRITHFQKLKDAAESTAVFLKSIDPLRSAGKLGPILFQLPPTAPFEAGRIERIVRLAPSHWRIAFQFRHPSWHIAAVADQLEEIGAAFVHGDGEPQPGPLGRGAFIYLRLRREAYSAQRLALWSRRVAGYLTEGKDVFLYFKHEKFGPLYAERLAAKVQTSFRVGGEAAV